LWIFEYYIGCASQASVVERDGILLIGRIFFFDGNDSEVVLFDLLAKMIYGLLDVIPVSGFDAGLFLASQFSGLLLNQLIE